MLLLPAYNFTCTKIINVCCTEQRFRIHRSERTELSQVSMQFPCNILKINHGIDIQYRLCLLRLDMLINIFLESPTEFRHAGT